MKTVKIVKTVVNIILNIMACATIIYFLYGTIYLLVKIYNGESFGSISSNSLWYMWSSLFVSSINLIFLIKCLVNKDSKNGKIFLTMNITSLILFIVFFIFIVIGYFDIIDILYYLTFPGVVLSLALWVTKTVFVLKNRKLKNIENASEI